MKGIRNRVEHFFADGESFDDMLIVAIRETPPEKGRTLDILGGLLAAWDAYGMRARMSEGQWSVLWRAAGYDSEPEGFAPND